MSACEWEPTAEEKRVYFEHVIEGRVKFLGGFHTDVKEGVVVTTRISPKAQQAEETARARQELKLQ